MFKRSSDTLNVIRVKLPQPMQTKTSQNIQMKSQIRQLQVLAEIAASLQDSDVRRSHGRSTSSLEVAEEGFELSLRTPPMKGNNESESRLEYLLQRDAGFEVDIGTVTGSSEGCHSGHTAHYGHRENVEGSESVPTLDIHFSNPQVQLHSKTTGGSIILAMEGAHVEGRKFIHFLVVHAPNKNGKVSPSDFIRKTGKAIVCSMYHPI